MRLKTDLAEEEVLELEVAVREPLLVHVPERVSVCERESE